MSIWPHYLFLMILPLKPVEWISVAVIAPAGRWNYDNNSLSWLLSNRLHASFFFSFPQQCYRHSNTYYPFGGLRFKISFYIRFQGYYINSLFAQIFYFLFTVFDILFEFPCGLCFHRVDASLILVRWLDLLINGFALFSSRQSLHDTYFYIWCVKWSSGFFCRRYLLFWCARGLDGLENVSLNMYVSFHCLHVRWCRRAHDGLLL